LAVTVERYRGGLNKIKVGIIGAGPAGLTCAYQLTKAGINVDVYETSDSVGGLAKTIELWNQRVDLGPHRFFSRDVRVNELWLEVIGTEYSMIDRLTRILYNNQFYKYPIQPLDALTKLGPVEVFRCLTSYMIENLSLGNGKESNFEDWVVSRFGRRLYEIFFKTYSEKLWGIPCNTLDADFATQRIKRFSLYEALKSALMLNNTGKHKTLVEKFAYPNEGSGKIYELMAGSVCENGGNILLNTLCKESYQLKRHGFRARACRWNCQKLRSYCFNNATHSACVEDGWNE
jgi:protoporphyrinogen oxidase